MELESGEVDGSENRYPDMAQSLHVEMWNRGGRESRKSWGEIWKRGWGCAIFANKGAAVL